MAPTDNEDQLADSTEEFEEEPPRSLFRARWFRIVLVALAVAAIAAVSLPYVIDYVSPPRKPPAVAKAASPAPATPAATPAPTTTPPAAPPAAPASPTPSPGMPAVPPTATPAAPVSPGAQTAQSSTPRATVPAETPKPAAPKSTAAAPSAATAEKPATTEKSKSPEPARARSAKAVVKPQASPAGGEYWVQVGAFRNPETATRVAASLRDQSFNVSESVTTVKGATAPDSAPAAKASRPTAAGSSVDRYDVYVTGSSSSDLGAKLASKGLTVEASGDGVVVRPSLPLRDAVALSKDLATDGLKVQVKRARGAEGTPAVTPPAPSAAPASTPESLHRVRVGAFADRAAAEAAVRDLEAKGFKPFIARGRE